MIDTHCTAIGACIKPTGTGDLKMTKITKNLFKYVARGPE